MSIFPGSSAIPVLSTVIPGINGIRGDTGPTGPQGPTGDALIGNTGPTGQGISNIFYFDSGISFENFDGNVLYVQFSGISGVSFIDGIPQSVIVARGLTSGPPSKAGQSILYSFVDSFVSANKIVIQPNFSGFDPQNDEIKLKIRSFEARGSALESISADASNIYLAGKTFTFINVGNTGEILFKKDDLLFAIDGSLYSENNSILSVPLAADRLVIHNNQNIGTPTYIFSNQNISGFSGDTGFGFFSVNNGTFQLNNGNYQPTQSPLTSQIRLDVGRTGSDNLIFKFIKSSYIDDLVFKPQVVELSSIGSCCFCNSDTTEIGCLDYVSSSYCANVGGSFSTTSCMNRISSGDCFSEGACCVNGKCINSSMEKCLQYKGTFFPGEICSGEQNESSHFACPSTCGTTPTTGKCCYKGFCLNLTNLECSSIPGAAFSSGTCISENLDPTCCSGLIGACCRKISDEYTCEQTTANNCNTQGGIFHGIGSLCAEIQCCGVNFIENYFNSDTECRVTTVEPCLPIGSKVGGGYLVGVIGMPSPCNAYGNPIGAYGQPLACRVHPRGIVNGTNGYLWDWKNCGGVNGAALGTAGCNGNEISIEYFIRTKSSNGIDLSYENNALKQCLVKHGVPYIQQTLTDIVNIQGTQTTVSWNNPIQYIGASAYNAANGRFAYPIGSDTNLNYLISEKLSDSSNLYKELASKFYGENSIHMLWALIVAPEDAYDGNNLSWGMEEGRARLTGFNDEPITTFAIDGLLSTRMFDETSKFNPRLWFRGNGQTDLKAYDRFAFFNTTNISKRSNWNFSVVEDAIETNIELFSQKYSEMWDANNPENSCTRQISILNQNQYKGYNDWYIPSIVELNYIHNNIININSEILLNGDSPVLLEGTEYWSSTSVCQLKSWADNDHLDYSSYGLEESASTINKNEKFRFKKSDYSGLNDKKAYELSLATCAGENMLTQNFSQGSGSQNDGLMVSRNRRTGAAKLRPVRRIPIIIGCVSENIEQFLVDSYFSNCPSCPGICSPVISPENQ